MQWLRLADKKQCLESVRQEEGSPDTAAPVPETPEHHTTRVGGADNSPHGRSGHGSCAFRHVTSHSLGPGQY
jgi:hypothetical protein